MTKNVITIDKNKSIFDACNSYKKHKVGCLIVTNDDKCVGILTERDIIERTICERVDYEKVSVEDIMTKDLFSIHPLESLEHAIQIMSDRKIKKLPVMNDKGIVGIITVTDISKARPDISKRFVESWVRPVWR